MPHVLPYWIVGCMLGACLAFAIYSQSKAVRLNTRGWEEILTQVHRVNIEDLTTVALDYLNPQKGQIAIQPRVLWKLVGAFEGLRHLRANADLMLALAAHAQQWNFDEATVVAERMRRDALRLRRALTKIELGFLPFTVLRKLYVYTPFHIQEAAAAYYLMRQRLLALYESSHSARYPALAAVL